MTPNPTTLMRPTLTVFLFVLLSSTAASQDPGRRLTFDRAIDIPDASIGGIAWDGEALWAAPMRVADEDTSQVVHYVVDTSGTMLDTLRLPRPLGESSGGLAWIGDTLLRVEEQMGRVYRMTRSGDTINSFRTPDSAGLLNSWGIAVDGRRLYLSVYDSDSALYELDPTTGAVLRQLPVPSFRVLGITMVGRRLIGADFYRGLLYHLDPETAAVLAVDTLPLPNVLGLAYDGAHLWVAARNGFGARSVIHRIDARFEQTVDAPIERVQQDGQSPSLSIGEGVDSRAPIIVGGRPRAARGPRDAQ